MEPPFTKEFLKNFDLDVYLRKNAIEQSVKYLTNIILQAAHFSKIGRAPNSTDWAFTYRDRITIFTCGLTRYLYGFDSIGLQYRKAFLDIIPDVIERLQQNFPDVHFSQDELKTILVVDWS